MDRNGKSDVKQGAESQNGAVNGNRNGITQEDDESQLLLPSKGGLSKKSGKPRMKVQWNDKNGDKLAEVLEYQPSDASDSDEDDGDSCFCRVM